MSCVCVPVGLITITARILFRMGGMYLKLHMSIFLFVADHRLIDPSNWDLEVLHLLLP